MGKIFKNFIEDGKVRKIEQFTHLVKISQGLRKSKISFHKECENFTTLRNYAKNLQPQSYFAKTCAKLKRVCEPSL